MYNFIGNFNKIKRLKTIFKKYCVPNDNQSHGYTTIVIL